MSDFDGASLLISLARAVRESGVAVCSDRVMNFCRAASLGCVTDVAHIRIAGHATLCSSPRDIAVFDSVLVHWIAAIQDQQKDADAAVIELMTNSIGIDEAGNEPDLQAGAQDTIRAAACDLEVLRSRDVAGLTPTQSALINTLFAELPCGLPIRKSRRSQRRSRGALDIAATLRAHMRTLGEPTQIRWRRSRTQYRQVIWLIDVSGSMEPYVDPLLRVGHRFANLTPPVMCGGAEVFTIGTRVTRVTQALRHRDPDGAIEAAGNLVPDWSGGTRLSATLGEFVDRWGKAGMAREAVVVIASDGWESGEVEDLAHQVARIRLMAHRVVWLNPHSGKDGYRPIQRGIKAVLPHVDHFVAGHSLAAYAEVVELVRRTR